LSGERLFFPFLFQASGVQIVGRHQQLQGDLGRHLELGDVSGGAVCVFRFGGREGVFVSAAALKSAQTRMKK
jgi:hypothetical protein